MYEFLYACLQLDPIAIIKAGGYIGIGLVVFAESGLLIGVLFPGDSLLFASGLVASSELLSIIPLIITIVIAAILGDSVGYWFGKSVGTRFFTREESFFFKKSYVARTERFYETYGGRAVILARFVPIVRTMTPIFAGIGTMPYRRFLSYNIIGACIWGISITLAGYALGSIIPNSERFILPISLLIIVVSFLPIVINLIQEKRRALKK